MRITQITGSYERKFALPEYSNFKVFCGMTAELEKGDNEEEALKKLVSLCKQTVESEGEQRLKEFYDIRKARKEIKEPK